jgi:hypothetical protein
MGWSFSVSCKSAKAYKEMLAFLEEHYLPSSRVLPWAKDHWRYKHPKLPSPPGGIKYGGGKTSIGFNSPTDHEQAVLRWIAFRVGRKRAFKNKLEAGVGAVPWVNLDGTDSMPVITTDQWDGQERTKQYVVDDNGWQRLHRWWEDYVPDAEYAQKLAGWVAGADGKDTLIKADIERLDALWLA